MIQLLQQGILLLGTLISGVVDAKTGYIYDWITYPMILLGIILALLSFSWFNLLSGAIIFVLLFAGYYLGKIGGGDVKLFTAIALLNPFNDFNFLISLFFIAAMSGMLFYSIYYTVKYYRKGIKIEREKKGFFNAFFIGITLIAYFFIMAQSGIISIWFVYVIGLPLLAGLLFVALQKGIKEEFFEQKIALNKLEEDEVLGEKNSEKIKKIIGKNLVGEKEILVLKKAKIKEIYVLRNLPKFGPFIFIGTIVATFSPEFLLMLFL